MAPAVKVQDLSKRYRLGLTHAGSVRDFVNGIAGRLWRRATNRRAESDVSRQHSTDSEEFWALRDINFDIHPGEVIGIIGRNGAGKSTLLKILSRITSPTSGRVEMRGRVASLLEVGTGFHPELTGRENVYLNGTILGMKKAEVDRQFDAIVDFSGVAKFIDTPVKRYSSGMKVRLGFGVAAHLEPEILIVDEVLAVGDVEFQKQCIGKMQNVAESGKTVLFVSHNLASIRSLTRRTIVLAKGMLIFDGATDSGVAAYLRENLITPDSETAIADAPRPFTGLDGRLRFVHLQIKSCSIDGSHPAGKPLRFAATILAAEPCEDFMIGLTIYSEDKSPVGSTFSGPVPSPDAHSAETYEFAGDFPLAPGRYHCAISLSNSRSQGKLLHDSLSDVLPFEIMLPATDLVGWHRAWGSVRLPPLVVLNSAAKPEHEGVSKA